MSVPTPSSGAGSSYAGFEYQFLATAWLAMKLIWEQRLCDSITVEPASEEDVAAVLSAPSPIDEFSTYIGAPVAAAKLDIQIKQRAMAWTESSLRDVLKGEDAPAGSRGPKPRTRPLDNLQTDPTLHYILLTNAQVSPDLRNFVVEEISERSGATSLPVKPIVQSATTIAPRIGIVCEHSAARLKLELEKYLRLHGHVPDSTVVACSQQLIDEVRRRVLGEVPRLWRKDEIERIVLSNGGALDLSRTVVLPTVFAALEEHLEKQNRLLLTGEPGVGKTELAHELAIRQHCSPDAFRIVPSSVGIQGIRNALGTTDHDLFLIEDPWGHDRLMAEATAWAKELPVLFRKAGPNKRFIVTSRAGVRHEALGSSPIPGFTDSEFVLKPEHYSDEHRREIMRIQMLPAQPWQRDWIKRNESEWMKQLNVPLTIVHFANRVIQATIETELKIDEVLRLSNVGALSDNFALEIRERGQTTVAGALLLWALHHADGFVTSESARVGKAAVRVANYHESIDPEKVLAIFVGAGWFKLAKNGFIAHPTALTGIESLLASEPGTADEVMGAFLLGLVLDGQVSRAFSIIQWLQQRPSMIGGVVRNKIEEHLLHSFMLAEGYEARMAFNHLTKYAVSTKPSIQLVRTLKPQHGDGPAYAIEYWQPPKLTTIQITDITASKEALDVARKFVVAVLPNDSWCLYSANDLVSFFKQFSWVFEAEFSTLALDAIDKIESNSRLDFLVEAALLSGYSNFTAFTEAILTASDYATELWKKNTENRLRGDQAEIDADYASYLEEEGSELFSPIERTLDLIVTARRQAEGWKWLDSHPRRPELLWAWAKSVTGNATAEEFAALADACTTSRRPFWRALAGSGNHQKFQQLLGEASTGTVDEIQDWVKQMAKLATATDWNEIVMPVITKLPFPHRMMLSQIDHEGEDHADRLSSLHSILSMVEQDTLSICKAAAKGETLSLSVTDAHTTGLRELAQNGSGFFKRAATIALAVQKENVDQLVVLLSASRDYEDRLAVLIAIARSRSDGESRALSALADPDYRVRRLALHILSGSAEIEPWPYILGMEKDPSAPVRAACAETIGNKKYVAGLPVLIRLLDDRRDSRPSSLTKASWPNHHVARAAGTALCKFKLDQATVSACISFLEKRGALSAKEEDVEVDHHVLLAMSDADDDRLIPFFSRLLDSHWHVSGQKGSGYPLRFTAAWCLAMQLAHFPSKAQQVDLPLVATAAIHNDNRLAGPALITLSFSGQYATPHILEVVRAAITTPDRAILLESCLDADMATARAALQAKSGANHPARAFLDLTSADFPTKEKWPSWPARQKIFKQWLDGIQSKDGLNPWLRFALGLHFPDGAPPEFASDDKLESLLPVPMQAMSLRSMFGGE